MCNLLLFVFSYHYFLFPCVCVCMCVCLCVSVCPSIRPTTETWPFLITAICVYQEPLQSVEPQEQTQWQSCYSRESKKAYTCAQMWLYVYEVFLNTKENFRTKAPPPQKKEEKTPQKTCTIPSSLWQEPGHRSDCGGRFWQRIENKPMYGEMLQTLILLALRNTILEHFEVSHASTTILGLVHLFIFYVFPSNETLERTCIVVFGLYVRELRRRGVSLSACLSVWLYSEYSLHQDLKTLHQTIIVAMTKHPYLWPIAKSGSD